MTCNTINVYVVVSVIDVLCMLYFHQLCICCYSTHDATLCLG